MDMLSEIGLIFPVFVVKCAFCARCTFFWRFPITLYIDTFFLCKIDYKDKKDTLIVWLIDNQRVTGGASFFDNLEKAHLPPKGAPLPIRYW
jgi:uncharacterized membrane protein